MKYRGRLVLIAVASCSAAVVLGLAVSPLLGLLRDRLHLGCTLSSDDGSPGWVCPDGVGYVLAALVLAAALAGLVFAVSVVAMVRRLTRQGAGPDLGRAIARDVGRVGAAPLVLQAPVSVLAAASPAYSSRALVLGLLVGAAGLLPFLAVRARDWLYGAACTAAAVMAVLAAAPAALLAPFIVGCAALLVCATAVSVFGETRRPGARADAPTS